MLRLRGARSGVLMQQIGRLFLEGTSIGSSEGELLDRFVRAHDESAFEALVARHGPMVLGVCRQLLRDPNDVDDAFQATFLVLVRKAAYSATVRPAGQLAVWRRLPRGDACAQPGSQTNWSIRCTRSRSRSWPTRKTCKIRHAPAATLTELEPRPWLHHEVSHLPEKYRTPIVLCYFEGLTHDEAANRMGCPLGTVKGRLSRARDLLRRRLTRRGVALSAAALASQLAATHAQAAVPASLELATTRAALSLLSSAGTSIAWGSSVSIPVTSMAEGVLNTMFWNQVRITAVTIFVGGTLATGFVVGATQLGQGSGRRDGTPAAAEGKQARAAGAQKRIRRPQASSSPGFVG